MTKQIYFTQYNYDKKILSAKQIIIQNNEKITELTSGAGTVVRINSINYLRQAIMSKEPVKLAPHIKKTPLDYTNMYNLSTEYDYILENKDKTINTKRIFDLYQIIVTETNLDEKSPRFRKNTAIPNIPNNDSNITFAPNPEKIPKQIEQVLQNLNDVKQSDTLTRAFNAHYELIILQPFSDYNKRLARFIMNWYLLQNNFTPIIFNKKTDKTEYINAISARIKGDNKTYTKNMEKSILSTQQQLIKILTRNKIIH